MISSNTAGSEALSKRFVNDKGLEQRNYTSRHGMPPPQLCNNP